MKKKLFISMLCASMLFSCAACGSNPTSTENASDVTTESANHSDQDYMETMESSEEESALVSSDEEQSDTAIIRAEELYEDDDENRALMESLQGKIQFLDQSDVSVMMYAENKVYTNKYSDIITVAELGEQPEWIQYFENVNVTERVLYYANGKINCYKNSGVDFADIDFDPETDFIAGMGMGSLYVASRQDNGYVMKGYEENNDEWVLQSENLITRFENNMGDDISAEIKDILVVLGNVNGYEVYCRTNDNALYRVDRAREDGFYMTTSDPIAANVESIYGVASSTTNTVPIHSKAGDENAVYAASHGRSMASNDDDFEITFMMPDGHKPDEIKDIFEANSSIVFVFENGDTYITDEIEEIERDTYEMKKLEEISALNSEGKIIDMSGDASSLFSKNIYILMDTNELYYYELDR